MMVSHNTVPGFPTASPRMYQALKVMERQCPPLKYGQPPYWRAPITPASEEVYVPVWNWVSPHDFPEGASVSVLDVNGAYLAALGSVEIAHSHLIHRGPFPHLPAPRHVQPGYYRITVPYWGFDGTIVHPLGDSARLSTETAVWIAAPTLVLLLELEEEGHIGHFEIIDSYTPDRTANFRTWHARLKSIREEFMDRIDVAQTETQRAYERERYDAFKQGYSSALSMMLTGEKCQTRRPDWTHTVYAQHAAATWRKAWRYTYTGYSLVAMGAVDEISVMSEDLPKALGRSKPPFRYDARGRILGAFKPKSTTFIGCEPPPRHALALPDTDMEDRW